MSQMWTNAYFLDRVADLRPQLGSITLPDILNGDAPPDILHEIDSVLLDICERERALIHFVILGQAEERSQEIWGVTSQQIQEWCQTRYHDTLRMPDLMLCFAISALPGNCGIQWHRGAVGQRYPNLKLDKTGLLDSRQDTPLDFTRHGVLIGQDLLLYNPDLLRYNPSLSGGFLDKLLSQFHAITDQETQFGIALDHGLVLDRGYFVELETKEFIRGPIGLSVEQLQDPSFPQDRRGTVTVHRRLENTPLLRLTGGDLHALEVMWSFRTEDGIKTVLIEELVPPNASQFTHESFVLNRFVHAEWSIEKECFVHFDGAVRRYEKKTYDSRFQWDIKQFRERGLKPSNYQKLFRLDSNLVLKEWCELVASFFRGNELVIEYFDGERS